MLMPAIDSSAVFTLRDHASMQSVGDGAVVLLTDTGQLYTCNETTEAFLSKLDGQRTFSEVIELLGVEFEADSATLSDDFGGLASQLLDEQIIRRVN